MGNLTSTFIPHNLSLHKITFSHHHSVSIFCDPIATKRENPNSDEIISPLKNTTILSVETDPEGGIVAFALWPGALHITRQLLFTNHNFFEGKRVIELGCGVGLPGICIGKFSKPSEIVLTDRASSRKTVEASIGLNDVSTICRFESFDWGNERDLKSFSSQYFDYVIGSEIVYAEEQAPLVNALMAVTESAPDTTRVILSYTNRSGSDAEYFESEIMKKFKIDEKISENIFIFSRIIA